MPQILRKSSLVVLLIIFVMMGIVVPARLRAQSSDFQQRQQAFLSMLEQYRTQKDNFLLAKEQYKKLNTLASQELALSEAHAFTDLRASILLEYLDMLKTQLSNTDGIPLEVKNPELIQIDLLKDKVNVHRTNLQQASDRLQIDEETKRFAADYDEVEGNSYFILSIMKVGAMQVAADKLDFTRQATQDFVMSQEMTASQRAAKERGFGEIDRAMVELKTEFDPIKKDLFNKQKSSLGQYTSLTEDLQGVYSQIRKVITFLEEIRKPQ